MEGIPERDKRKGKEKVEDSGGFPPPKPRFSCQGDDDLYYLKLFGSQPRAETHSSAEQVERKLFRIRNKEVGKVLGKEDERIKNIHGVSGATIGIISDTSAKIHRHSYLELLGTPDQNKIAELLILDAIMETYEAPFVPTALMPTRICHHKIHIPLNKVVPLLGIDGDNILKMESQSRAWIELDTFHPPPGGKTWERAVNIYGHGPQVATALTMIQQKLCQHHPESIPSENDWELLVEEMASAEEAEHEEPSAKLEEAGCSEEAGHKDSENEMQQHVDGGEHKESAQPLHADEGEHKESTQPQHADEVN